MAHKQQKPVRGKQIEFKFRKGQTVGNIVAEHDSFLKQTFVDAGYLATLLDVKNSSCVVVGRTGVGKSALLLHIEQTAHRVRRVDPLSVAIGYVQTDTIIPKLAEAGVNLDAFFKYLWRQVLVLEVLRAWPVLSDNRNFDDVVNRLMAHVLPAQRRRQQVLDDLKHVVGPDWRDPEHASKEIIRDFNVKLKGSLGHAKVAQLEGEWSRQVKRTTPPAPIPSLPPSPTVSLAAPPAHVDDVVQQAIAALSNQRVQERYTFLKADVLVDKQRPLYVLVDEVDTAWVDSPFAYDMLYALIEVAGEFALLPNMKVIVALRDDLVVALRSQINQNRRRHQQWEKHESLFLRVQWSEVELGTLIDNRLRELLRGKYGGEITFATLLPPPRPKHSGSTADHVLRRASRRPRDLIAFVNRILEETAAREKTSASWEILTAAESVYSRERLEALENEWRSNYTDLRPLCEVFRGFRPQFTIPELDAERLLTLELQAEALSTAGRLDPLSVLATCYALAATKAPDVEVWRTLLGVLYRIGFVGVKRSTTEPLRFVFDEPRPMDLVITEAMTLAVNPAYWRALDITG